MKHCIYSEFVTYMCVYSILAMAEGETPLVPPVDGDAEPDTSTSPSAATTEKPPPSPPTAEVAAVSISGGGGGESESSAAKAPSMPPTPQEKKAREFAEQAEKKYKSSLTFFGGLFGYVCITLCVFC